jgi:hypothetical protein
LLDFIYFYYNLNKLFFIYDKIRNGSTVFQNLDDHWIKKNSIINLKNEFYLWIKYLTPCFGPWINFVNGLPIDRFLKLKPTSLQSHLSQLTSGDLRKCVTSPLSRSGPWRDLWGDYTSLVLNGNFKASFVMVISYVSLGIH